MWAMMQKLRMRAWSMALLGAYGPAAVGPWPRSGGDGGRGVGEGHAVAALGLHAVERAIGARQGRALRLVLSGHGDADGGGDPETSLGDGGAQARGRLQRLGLRADDDQRRELVAADAEQLVAAADRAAQRVGDPPQDGVAVLMTVRVVERLEAVEVADDDRGARPTVGAREGGLEGRVMTETG